MVQDLSISVHPNCSRDPWGQRPAATGELEAAWGQQQPLPSRCASHGSSITTLESRTCFQILKAFGGLLILFLSSLLRTSLIPSAHERPAAAHPAAAPGTAGAGAKGLERPWSISPGQGTGGSWNEWF